MLDTGIEELERLRRANRDLAACLTLPALWGGREPPYIMTTLLDVLVSMLQLDLGYAVIFDANGHRAFETCRPETAIPSATIAQAVERWPPDEDTIAGVTADLSGIGTVRLARLPLRLRSGGGTVVAASLRSDFPTERDMVLLRAAVNQAGIALTTAYLVLTEQTLLAREQAARAEVERAGRLKDEFLALLSHELRTPLNAILGYAHLLGLKSLPPERAEHALQAIERNAHAQARLVESLLDLSRIIAGKLELELQPVDVSSLVQAAVDVVRPDADARSIALNVVVPSVPVGVVGDGSRLEQIFWNLLSNAVKFTRSGGRVEVRVAQADSGVQISVSDTGQGIHAEFLPYVFDRFAQASGGEGRAHGGLGLGLALVRELVQAHGGTVVAESAGEGQGSTFIVTLPAPAAATMSLESHAMGARVVERQKE